MKKQIITISLVFILVSLSFVAAFGVASPGAAVEMNLGETIEISLNVQNGAGATEDVTARMNLIESAGVATFPDGDYLVKAGGEIYVPITITIPEDAEIGAVYTIKVETRTVTPGDSGGAAMGIGITSQFDVNVIAEPVIVEIPAEISTVPSGMSTVTWILIIVGSLIVIVVIVIIIIKKREN